MKKALSIILILMTVVAVYAQEEQKEEKNKTGWNFGVLPAVTFDTDMGFQYGGLIDLYNYGTGDIYPEYYHKFYLEVSRFTKGSAIYRFNYESWDLIPGVRTFSDLSLLTDRAFDFYGFNGYEAVINKGWFDEELNTGDYRTRMFYRLDRSLLRFKNDFEGTLAGENLKWNAGFAIQNFKLDSVDVAKFNKGKDAGDRLPWVSDEPGLYDLYKQWGIFTPEEADGGLINTIKAGISFDTRDNRPNPMKGLWTEGGIELSAELLGSESTFAKFYFTHRQYFTLIPEDLSFVYRLGYQQTLFGDVPFYYQSQVIVSALRGAYSEGLGGSKTLRGIWRYRVIGNGFFHGNAEFRWKAVRFNFINQNFYIGLNAFSDFGMVTDKIGFTVPDLTSTGYNASDFFNSGTEKLHIAAGAGSRIVMNENFIIAVDLGKAFNDQDGNMGFYMGLNYLF